MFTIKLISTTLFVILLAGLVPFASTLRIQNSIYDFINRLQKHLISVPTSISFTMRSYVFYELGETTTEFQDLCFGYDRQYGNPATALNKTINYIFYLYKEEGDEDILEEIEQGDPVGFNAYLRAKRVDKKDSDFMKHTNIFVSTMRDRIRLQQLKFELTAIPEDVRYPIATEYSGLQAPPINYFIKLAAEKTHKKMYPINLVVMDEFDTYTKKNVDDVQVFGATYYDYMNAMTPKLHALCINYKASTKMVHVYDSGYNEYQETLEGRQKGIIQKLYPDREIKYEKSTALQSQNTTCSLFAITYATFLLLGRDPAIDHIKRNDVHGDETLYMRLHIMDMLSKRKLFLPKQWGLK